MAKPRPLEVVSYTMRQVRSTDTTPELRLRKALWRSGLRYRLHAKALPGSPDIVFPRQRVAVFVDGDFWHGHQWQSRGLPSLRAQFRETPTVEYWVKKIERNVQRDADVNKSLAETGWQVLRLWETDLQRDLSACVQTVINALKEAPKRK